MKTQQERMKENIKGAVEQLADCHRGRQALQGLLQMLDNGAGGLESENQKAAITIFVSMLGAFPGTVREEIEKAEFLDNCSRLRISPAN